MDSAINESIASNFSTESWVKRLAFSNINIDKVLSKILGLRRCTVYSVLAFGLVDLLEKLGSIYQVFQYFFLRKKLVNMFCFTRLMTICSAVIDTSVKLLEALLKFRGRSRRLQLFSMRISY